MSLRSISRRQEKGYFPPVEIPQRNFTHRAGAFLTALIYSCEIPTLALDHPGDFILVRWRVVRFGFKGGSILPGGASFQPRLYPNTGRVRRRYPFPHSLRPAQYRRTQGRYVRSSSDSDKHVRKIRIVATCRTYLTCSSHMRPHMRTSPDTSVVRAPSLRSSAPSDLEVKPARS